MKNSKNKKELVFFSKNKNKKTRIRFIDIIMVVAEDNYARIYYKKRCVFLSSKSLKVIEEYLPENIFFKVHKSYIVNIVKIKEILRSKKNNIVLENDEVLTASQRNMPKLRRKLRELNIILNRPY